MFGATQNVDRPCRKDPLQSYKLCKCPCEYQLSTYAILTREDQMGWLNQRTFLRECIGVVSIPRWTVIPAEKMWEWQELLSGVFLSEVWSKRRSNPLPPQAYPASNLLTGGATESIYFRFWRSSMGSLDCFRFCTKKGRFRDQFQWIIRKQLLLWKYITSPYWILGHCERIKFTEVTPVFDIKSTTDFPPQNPVGRTLLLQLCVTHQSRLSSHSESSLLDLQCLDKSGLGFGASLQKSSVLEIARLRQGLAKERRI